VRAQAWAAALLTSALLTTVLLAAAIADDRSRYDELKRVIDRNTGFAHMTRGMNMYTLVALRSCVTEGDIPVLTRLLTDRDHVTQLSAANVLADLGNEGKQALRQALATPPDIRTRSVVEDALREADSPAYRPIQDYPLTESERKRIRGCKPPAPPK